MTATATDRDFKESQRIRNRTRFIMAELARIAAAARQPLRIITRPRISPSTSSYLGLSLSHSRNAATALRRKDEKRNIARTDSNDKERMRRLEAGASFLLPREFIFIYLFPLLILVLPYSTYFF